MFQEPAPPPENLTELKTEFLSHHRHTDLGAELLPGPVMALVDRVQGESARELTAAIWSEVVGEGGVMRSPLPSLS